MAEVIDFGAGTLSNSGIPMPCLVLPRALAELRDKCWALLLGDMQQLTTLLWT